MISLRCAGAALLLLVGGPACVAAQELRGTVSDSVSGRGVPGAVLLLLDSAGSTIGRNITDARGDYRIALSGMIRRMRVMRIGFRPREVIVPRLAAGVARLDVSVVAIPTLLEPVRANSNASCPKRSDRAAALALLEQARAGLLATVVAREAKPARMVRLRFERRMVEMSDRVASQNVWIDSSDRVAVSYRAAHDASHFVQLGFSEVVDGREKFYGPDADVLLDDAFSAGYCFQIADRDRRRPGQIGLAFTPAKRRRGRVDIEGALWIDSVARELRDIEFRYLGLERVFEPADPGGHVEFRTMANGLVIIDRWRFRLAGVDEDTTGGRTFRTMTTRFAARESGGEVATATWPDSVSWRGSLGALRGRVVDRSGNPAANVAVWLPHTDYRATSRDDGTFEISDLLPGPYTASVADSLLAALQIALRTSLAFTAARDSVVDVQFRVPSAAEVIADACRADRIDATAGPDADETMRLMARVVDGAGAPVDGVHLKLSVETLDTDQGSVVVADGGRTGSDGLFHYCGRLKLNDVLVIRAQAGSGPPQYTRLPVRRVMVVRIVLAVP